MGTHFVLLVLNKTIFIYGQDFNYVLGFAFSKRNHILFVQFVHTKPKIIFDVFEKICLFQYLAVCVLLKKYYIITLKCSNK